MSFIGGLCVNIKTTTVLNSNKNLVLPSKRPFSSSMLMPIITTQQEIAQLQKRLAFLNEQAEDQLRQKLAEARKVVTELELQLSEITGRPTATQIKVVKGFAPLTDEELEVQILFVVQKEGQRGMNAKTISQKLNQAPQRIRLWIKAHPGVLKRVGAGPGTRFFIKKESEL